jgi:hypothetical protein
MYSTNGQYYQCRTPNYEERMLKYIPGSRTHSTTQFLLMQMFAWHSFPRTMRVYSKSQYGVVKWCILPKCLKTVGSFGASSVALWNHCSASSARLFCTHNTSYISTLSEPKGEIYADIPTFIFRCLNIQYYSNITLETCQPIFWDSPPCNALKVKNSACCK